MADDSGPPYGIGALARRTGLSVRTIRFWSDAGLVPPVTWTSAGHRRYDAVALARLELVATLRQLGIGLAAIRSVLEQRTTIAEVAAVHAQAIAAEIDVLRVHRTVLVAIAARQPGIKEMKLMNDLARLSAAERQRLVDDFLAETFGDGPDATGIRLRMRELTPALPDDPTPEQVQAWIDVAQLVQDPSFRARVRGMAEAGRREARDEPFDRQAGRAFAAAVGEHAGAALEAGVDPGSLAAEQTIEAVLPDAGPTKRSQVARQLATFSDARLDRYWQLIGIINGWPPQPSRLPAFEWLREAFEARFSDA